MAESRIVPVPSGVKAPSGIAVSVSSFSLGAVLDAEVEDSSLLLSCCEGAEGFGVEEADGEGFVLADADGVAELAVVWADSL